MAVHTLISSFACKREHGPARSRIKQCCILEGQPVEYLLHWFPLRVIRTRYMSFACHSTITVFRKLAWGKLCVASSDKSLRAGQGNDKGVAGVLISMFEALQCFTHYYF